MAIVENDYAAYLKTSDGEMPLRDLDAQEKIGSLSEDIADIESVGFDVYKSKNIFNPAGVNENSWLLLDGTIQTPSPYGTDTSVYSGSVSRDRKSVV